MLATFFWLNTSLNTLRRRASLAAGFGTQPPASKTGLGPVVGLGGGGGSGGGGPPGNGGGGP